MFTMLEDKDDDQSVGHLVVVSPSEIDTMRQCGLKHQLFYGERWTKEAPDTDPRSVGTVWHRIMERHYKAIKFHQDLARKEHGRWSKFDRIAAREMALLGANDVLDSVSDDDIRDTLDWMYRGHLEYYGLDDRWEIVATEFSAEVELPGPPGFDTPFRFRLKIRIDLIVREAGRVWIIDFKSCKNLPNNLDLQFDDQFGLYHWGMGALGYNVFGTVHAAARKTRLVGDATGKKITPFEERFRRSPMSRGKQELDTIAIEAWQQADEKYAGLQKILTMRRMGLDLDVQRSPNPNTCGWRCDVTEACIASRKGTDLRDYIYRMGFRKDRSRH